MTDLTKLRAKQNVWEGVKDIVYDDATGGYLRSGTRVIGNPTVGVGRNLMKPMSAAAIDFLWNEDAQEALNGASTFPWFANLNEARQLAIVDMVFNMGLGTLQTFNTFLNCMQEGYFGAAANDLENTRWYKQVGQRAVYLTNVIRTGEWT